MKKLLAMLLCVVMVLGLFAACNTQGGKNPNDPDETKPKRIGPDGRQIITIGLPQDVAVTDYDTNAYTKWLEEVSGYDLQFSYYASAAADYKTQLATALINENEELPDILWGFKGLGEDVWKLYGDDGYFLDLKPYFDDKEGASKDWWAMAEQLDPDFLDMVFIKATSEDGSIYAFPKIEQTDIDTMSYMPFINKTWLDKLGLPMPTDIDSLYDTLVAFRDRDPNGNGKKDEIPLVSQKGNSGQTDATDWIINMYLYFDASNMFAVSEDGQTITTPFTSDKYREALQFCKKLMDEGLLHASVYTMGKSEFNSLMNPSDGVPVVGIGLGHPTLNFTTGENSIYNYVAVPTWSYAVRGENQNVYSNFITEDANDPDACWELFMLMSSDESAIRQRYGQEGVDWVKADEGTKSFMGYDAKIKILNDNAFSGINNQTWHSIDCCILLGAENEYVQYDESVKESNPWLYYKNGLLRDLSVSFVNAEKNKNPKYILPKIYYDKEENLLTEDERSNVKSMWRTYSMSFIMGANKLDINNDASWNEYLKALDDAGLQTWLEQVQRMYEEDGYKEIVLN